MDTTSERVRQTRWEKYGESSEEDGLISAMCAEGVVLLQKGSGIYGRPLTKRVPGGEEFEGVVVEDITMLADVLCVRQGEALSRGRFCLF